MKIYPAIDILNGNVVRLLKGDFEKKTIYSTDPLTVAKEFQRAELEYLHIVDLNGANGDQRQTKLIKEITKKTALKVQVGGGVRNAQDVFELLSAGADRVVLGTLAVNDPEKSYSIISEVGASKITLAFDVVYRNGQYYPAVSGWKKSSNTTLEQILQLYEQFGDLQFLITDISKDGTLKGPNFSLYKAMTQDYGRLKILVSGGVSQIEDLEKARTIGAAGVIVGKAFYEKKLTLEQMKREGEKLC